MYYCDMVVSTIFITSVLCGAKHINRSGICIEHLNFVSYVCRSSGGTMVWNVKDKEETYDG